MGAAASVEAQRPADGSDLNDFFQSRDELLRLRQLLGHLAKDNGFAEVVYDGSDLIKGVNESEDHERCKAEVLHIRACLRLSTQNAKRVNRMYAPQSFFLGDDTVRGKEEEEDDEDESDIDGEQTIGEDREEVTSLH